jgi:hypothetical protein
MNSPVAPQSKNAFRAIEQEGFAGVFIDKSTKKESLSGDKELTERTGGTEEKEKLDMSRHIPPTASGHWCLTKLH